MPSCSTTVTTPTGKFTYHDETVSYCEAKEKCAEKGEILAPLTNFDDVDALRSVADRYNKSCQFHYGSHDYHIGLDVSWCGGKQHKMFTNNVVWNETLHGDLYIWRPLSRTKGQSLARFFAPSRKLFVVSNLASTARYICLKPSSTAAESLVKKDDFGYNDVLCGGGALMVALVGFLLVMRIRKQNNEVQKLKKENECLRNRMNGFSVGI